MTLSTAESRVNVMLRLVGLIFLVLGAAMTYLTYSEASQANIVPQIVPVFYLVSGLMMAIGFITTITRYK